MKGYFQKDYSYKKDTFDKIENFLKQKYDEADDIFNRRFLFSEGTDEENGKIAELQGKIQEIKDRIETEGQEGKFDKRLAALALGNLLFRMAQCREELFMESKPYYREAAAYFGVEIVKDNSNDNKEKDSEMNLLLRLNKGKYFRNTAQIGRKSVYEKAFDIFLDVTDKVIESSVDEEKKIHIYLDAFVNMGRVKRYAYEYDEAKKIFISTIILLEKYIDQDEADKLKNCPCLSRIRKLSDNNSWANRLKTLEEYIDRNRSAVFYKEYLIQGLIHIGIILRKEKNYNDAIAIFDLVNEIDGGENIDAENNLGVCYRKIGGKTAEAEKILEGLKAKGNRFASINLYKCYLMRNDAKHDKCFAELKEKCETSSSIQLKFILGLFYEKEGDYQTASRLFEEVYNARPYIARGSIGVKAYYNLSQCMILEKRYTQARKVLGKIRELLQKQSGEKDVMVEVDYGWCLMQERNYGQALKLYEKMAKEDEKEIGRRNWMRIHNNLAECYIHTEQTEKAKNILDRVIEKEQDNRWTKYLRAGIDLKRILEDIKKGNAETKEIEQTYKEFTSLAERKPALDLENAGWLISAILLLERYREIRKGQRQQELQKILIEKLRYSTEKITMKSYFYLADFMLKYLENCGKNEKDDDVLYRCFCHMELVDEEENMAFNNFMEGPNFHYFERKQRAKILANIVLMYKSILNIKNSCRYTYKKKEEDKNFPVHYTKLSTLKILLSHTSQENNKGEAPRLRLWNAAYMNDSYEGGTFWKLLCHAVEKKNHEPSSLDEIEEIFQTYYSNTGDVAGQTESEVYITSFSKDLNSFQMWNIYAEAEKGCAIRFDDAFFDIKDDYVDPIEDMGRNVYSLYEVQYYDVQEGKIKSENENFEEDMVLIWERLREIESILKAIEGGLKQEEADDIKRELFGNAALEVRSFVADRLNEIRFLFKTQSYEYEKELRLIRCSRSPKIDETNFDIPKLYIDVERDISNLEITLGEKLERSKVKELNVWLNCTGKVRKVNYIHERKN